MKGASQIVSCGFARNDDCCNNGSHRVLNNTYLQPVTDVDGVIHNAQHNGEDAPLICGGAHRVGRQRVCHLRLRRGGASACPAARRVNRVDGVNERAVTPAVTATQGGRGDGVESWLQWVTVKDDVTGGRVKFKL